MAKKSLCYRIKLATLPCLLAAGCPSFPRLSAPAPQAKPPAPIGTRRCASLSGCYGKSRQPAAHPKQRFGLRYRFGQGGVLIATEVRVLPHITVTWRRVTDTD